MVLVPFAIPADRVFACTTCVTPAYRRQAHKASILGALMLFDEFRKLSVEDVVGALKEFIAAHKVDAVSSPGYTSAKRMLDDAMVFDARSSSILSMLAPSTGPEADSIGPGTLGRRSAGGVFRAR